MYKTKEIRWFFKKQNQSIETWFETLPFDSFEKREDIYLCLGKDDVGVKLRDGNIEIKHLIGTRSRGCLETKAWGYFEDWVKWSFVADSGQEILMNITDGKRKRWLSVKKERQAGQLTMEDGAISIKPNHVSLKYGCQIEYCSIQVNGEQWYTFGLEWFGNRGLELDASLLHTILGKTTLKMNQSMGYPAFLSKLKNHKERTPLESLLIYLEF